jgi:hypothetical protein
MSGESVGFNDGTRARRKAAGLRSAGLDLYTDHDRLVTTAGEVGAWRCRWNGNVWSLDCWLQWRWSDVATIAGAEAL